MDINPDHPGICRRLFRLFRGALRRPSSTQLLIEEGSSRKVNNSLNHEVVVEFRHRTDGLIVSDDLSILQGRSNFDQNIGVKKSLTINNHSDDQLHDDTKLRRHWPLLDVSSNINEKSEEFIEKKKKAMRRNYSLDQDQK